MIFEGVKCGDCGKLVLRNIHIGRRGVPFWECPACGVYHEDWSWYRRISQEEATSIIETRKPKGLFVLDTGIEIVGIDNLTGDAWTEEFPDMEECLNWLVGNKEVWE